MNQEWKGKIRLVDFDNCWRRYSRSCGVDMGCYAGCQELGALRGVFE